MDMRSQQFLLLFFIVFLASAKVQQGQYGHLAKSKEINFTFYHVYEYPKPDCLQVAILIHEKGRMLSQLISKIINTTEALKNLTILYNSTLLDNSALSENSINIIWEEDFEIQKIVTIQTNNQKKNFAQMLDKMNQLRNQHRFFIDVVMEGRSTAINYQEENERAKIQISLKSNTICQTYFGMKLQEIIAIQKLNTKYQQKSTNQDGLNTMQVTESEDNLTSYFVGNLEEIADQIAEVEYQQNYEWQNAIYQCQIICKAVKQISIPKSTPSPKPNKSQGKASQPGKNKAKKISQIKEKYQNLEL